MHSTGLFLWILDSMAVMQMDQVFQKSQFGSMFMKDELNVPGPKPLPRARFLGNMPHVIVADEAFPLCPNIMRPYPRGRNASKMP